MSDTIIKVENLGKKYRLEHQRERPRYVSLREVVTDKFKGIFQKRNGSAPIHQATEEFWALKDVSFEVKKGEVVGIIGRNGAGKSTLLKILSRITEPTEGQMRLKGRLATLLEVGTGFHPELTGRENIFLNGAILGMHRSEIKQKFDEIVAFADVERFLDTPVKRYSSGMYVRLAFAVAAHLEPEILIVDEVLAVGDADFQKKCLGKMRQVSEGSGRTVLFVSHNMAAVSALCRRGIVLKAGKVGFVGEIGEAIAYYTRQAGSATDVAFQTDPTKPQITRITLDCDALAESRIAVEIEFKSPFPLSPPVGGLVLSSIGGAPILGSNPRYHLATSDCQRAASGILTAEFEAPSLHHGTYQLSVWLGDWHRDYDQQLNAITFEWKGRPYSGIIPNPEQIGHLDWPVVWGSREAQTSEVARDPSICGRI